VARGVVLASLLLAAVAARAQDAGVQPVYVMLVMTSGDSVNVQYADQQLTRVLALTERLRREHPGARASCLFEFTGETALGLAERAPTGLLGEVKRGMRQGHAEVGYNGTDEPTFVMRPRPNLRGATTPEQRWLARLQAATWFLTEGKDPYWGEPDPSRAGGLRAALDVFGSVASVAGVTLELGSDAEAMHVVARLTGGPVLAPGLQVPESFPARHIHGYRGSVAMVSRELSPAADTAPEVYWESGFLRISSYAGGAVRIVSAHEGPQALQQVIEGLDRSRPHVLQVRLGSPATYMKIPFGPRGYQTPAEHAHDNYKARALPAEALKSPEEIAAAGAAEEATLRWLIDEWFPKNPGSRFTSASELLRRARAAVPAEVPVDQAVAAATDLVTRWRELGMYPPSFAEAGGVYLSLADTFVLLVNALSRAEAASSARAMIALPAVGGPLLLVEPPAATPGRVPRRAVVDAAAALAPGLNDPTWADLPRNAIPHTVTVAGTAVPAVQFLRLMADALLQPGATDLPVEPTHIVSAAGESFPKTRVRTECGSTWTLKPAPLRDGGP
jgi:hypothetical protein